MLIFHSLFHFHCLFESYLMRTIVMLNVPVTGHPLISSLFVSSIVIVTHQKICHHIQLILCELCLVLLPIILMRSLELL